MSQNNESNQSTGTTVIAEVADVLAGSAPQVRDRLKNLLVEREVSKRVDLLDKALVKRQQLFIETKKFKLKTGTLIAEDGTKSKVTLPMTEDEVKAYEKGVKEAKEKLEKFDAALEKAFSGDKDAFDKLAKQVAGKSDEE